MPTETRRPNTAINPQTPLDASFIPSESSRSIHSVDTLHLAIAVRKYVPHPPRRGVPSNLRFSPIHLEGVQIAVVMFHTKGEGGIAAAFSAPDLFRVRLLRHVVPRIGENPCLGHRPFVQRCVGIDISYGHI